MHVKIKNPNRIFKSKPIMHGARASRGGEGTLSAAQVNMVVYDKVSPDDFMSRVISVRGKVAATQVFWQKRKFV